jgi:hypothetical protein
VFIGFRPDAETVGAHQYETWPISETHDCKAVTWPAPRRPQQPVRQMEPAVAISSPTWALGDRFGRDLDEAAAVPKCEPDTARVESVEAEPPRDPALRVNGDDTFDDARDQAGFGID